MKTIRQIIKIDEQLCNGCGACIEGCHEGALQLIDGKARIVSELYCDGLGACIGDCPVGAITIEEREAEPYNEHAVMERIATKGETTIIAHLKHLKDHGETEYLQQGIDYLKDHNINVDLSSIEAKGVFLDSKPKLGCGCSGSMEHSFAAASSNEVKVSSTQLQSQLTHWPVQLHLLNPQAGFFRKADVVIAADCTAYAYADFHNRFIHNHALAIACPKLDSNKESYVAKITEMIDLAQINTLTVVIMEVPCCGGLIQLVQMAAGKASRKVPIKKIVVGVQGDIKEETWV
ncbi:MAG TPA: 4Fe-4S ferredoxin [Bacteroidales bacterium]|nr:4Fe-4S ferredoxin [Bacteroidales bacterium]HQB75516.1 4Fe-4S ferredoxin [Bacteroidales bacterium]